MSENDVVVNNLESEREKKGKKYKERERYEK